LKLTLAELHACDFKLMRNHTATNVSCAINSV